MTRHVKSGMTKERFEANKLIRIERRYFHVSTLAYMIPNQDPNQAKRMAQPFVPFIRKLGSFRYAEKGGDYRYVFNNAGDLEDDGAMSYVDQHPKTKHHARKAQAMAA